MKAMILAAGIGSRLKPLTDSQPKALIEINGVPMLEIVIKRLIKAGVKEMIINVFYMADRITDFLKEKKYFGVPIEISRETQLLDTGGGLKKASYFFNDQESFFLHNADAFTEIDLSSLYRFHLENPALATLAVEERQSSRYFFFNGEGFLCGWESIAKNQKVWAREPIKESKRLAFNGIHVISPDFFSKMTETGVFSINQTYLRLAGKGEKIQAFPADSYYCQDIGSLEKLERVRQHVKEKGLPF